MKIRAAVAWTLASLLAVAGATVSDERKLAWGQAPSGTFYSMVAAVDYNEMSGAVVQASSEGIESIGFLDAGDSLTYQVTLPVAGRYAFHARVATPDGNGAFDVTNQDSSEVYATVVGLSATGDWDAWGTKTTDVTLPEGTVNLKIVVVEPGFNLLWLSLELVETEAPTLAPTTLAPTVAPTVVLVPDETTVVLPPPPALQQDVCLASMSAAEYLMMKDCGVNSADGTISLSAGSAVLFSLTVPTSGRYLLQMTVVRPSTGSLELVELQTQEQYAIMERMEPDAASSEPKWSMANSIVSLSSGTHLMQIRSLAGSWTLSSLCLQSIDSSNTCGSDIMINSSGPFVKEEAELVFGEQQEETGVDEQQEETGVDEQQEETEEVQEEEAVEQQEEESVDEQQVEAAEFEEEQSLEISFEENAECLVFVNAVDYTSMEGIVALDGSSAIGFLDAGDWFMYTLTIPQEGMYELDMAVASPLGEGAFEVVDMATPDDALATASRLPVTDSWDTWGSAVTLVNLPSGSLSLMIRVLQEGWNLQSLCLKAV